MSREDIILITDTKTNICRSFAITNPNWVESVKNYIYGSQVQVVWKLKKKIMWYKKGRCINSPIGINKIGTISEKIAKYLNFDCPMDTRLKFLK
jgi:hypothetical protein